MSATEYRFLEPLDVLVLRGNKLFGDPGSFGESLVPPWPSVAAGAIRSRMLVDAGIDVARFARGEQAHPELGTPARPGTFRLTAFHLARRHADGRVEMLVAPPADLAITREGDKGAPRAQALAPVDLSGHHGLMSSFPLPLHPLLARDVRDKPAVGHWLLERGWARYLAGEVPKPEDLVESSALWRIDGRVGVGLDPTRRAASEGRLFTVQAVAMARRDGRPGDGFDVGFLVGVSGAHPPTGGTVRLGGDGRAAAIRCVTFRTPEPDYGAIARERRCRVVLTSPGVFPLGWLPMGATRGEGRCIRFELHGVRGRIVCAAVPRAEVISGWDLARGSPKTAQRAAPTGSVYWLELDEGVGEPELRSLVARGLWGRDWEDAARQAEGFNRCTLAAWSARGG